VTVFADRDSLATSPTHAIALDCLAAGIRAAHPERVIAESVSLEGNTLSIADTAYDIGRYERVELVGGGKAAGTVAEALESLLGDRLDGGVVVSDEQADVDRVAVVRGDHPIPSAQGQAGAQRVLDAAERADADTLLLVTISGGASALLPAPREGVSLDALRSVTEELLESGAAIDEINAVRKHCSTSKGGGLAAAARPATSVGLVLSDVVGNDLGVIGSGPLSPDPTTFADALAVLDRYDLDGGPVREVIERGAAGDRSETPGHGDPVFEAVDVHVLADGRAALDAAAEAAADRGYEPHVLSSRIRGEAREAATTHVAIAEEIRATGDPFPAPAVLLSGGETTVTVRGNGTGGPNQEFACSAAISLDLEGVVVASVDTDGRDGASKAAGAIVDAGTVDDDAAARAALADNDAGGYLDGRGALLVTGPTGPNVNDVRAVVVDRD
jgi:hydroxypyruvate reductase